MTLIEINEEKITIRGHSGYEEHGKDIVCAAISSLSYSLYKNLLVVGCDVELKEDDAAYIIELKNINYIGSKLIKEFSERMKELEEQYKEYVRLI